MAYSLCSNNVIPVPEQVWGLEEWWSRRSETNQDLEDSAQEVVKYALKTYHGLLLGQRKE